MMAYSTDYRAEIPSRAPRALKRMGALLPVLGILVGPALQSGFAADGIAAVGTPSGESLIQTLSQRITQEPFHLVGTIVFVLAIIHTFLTPMFSRLGHRFTQQAELIKEKQPKARIKFKAQLFHFLGEVEAVFGIWVVPLMIAMSFFDGWPKAKAYLNGGVNFTEALFVIVIMAISASRPVLKLAESTMAILARIGGNSAAAWWLSILTVGPLLGSLITEPAAMTLSALLLARKFFDRQPSTGLAYATMGLLFVNVSVGGTLTHFAAPPVLMVSGKWGWDTSFMLAHFGWKALVGIVVANLCYLVVFRHEFKALAPAAEVLSGAEARAKAEDESIPLWVTLVSVAFMIWTVLNSHYPVLFLGGFLFYLAFAEATEDHQYEPNLRPPLLVGFFLAGLVVHGGLQGWWLEPILSSLAKLPLFMGAVVLTAFNDNAAITYLATLVPNFSEELKYAVVAGAVTGGGLTVIANAPNPAGQSILGKYFADGVSPFRLLIGALLPTAIMAALFLFL